MMGDKYFNPDKKGEVPDLRRLFLKAERSHDAIGTREAVKRTVAYMTRGIDVSPLFSEMIKATYTRNLVQKKLVYLFLCNYAESNAEMALLSVNTLQKDCRDENPMIRGLALRSMCSLRLSNIVEYLLGPLHAGLNDSNAYVRKTAVMGCAKLFYISPKTVREAKIADKLYEMLRDQDPLVVSNCICALEEILVEEGGIVVNAQLMLHLLNRLNSFNPWSQHVVLDLCARFQPEGEDQLFALLDLLDDRLKVSNGAVVLGAARVMLRLTADYPELHEDVHRRIKEPLLTLANAGSVEMMHVVLSHILLLVNRCPGLLSGRDYLHLLCKEDDPSHVKQLKIRLLTLVADPTTAGNIIAEMAEYASEADEGLAKRAVRAIGVIAIRLRSAVHQALAQLVAFLGESTEQHVLSETIVVMQDVLRKYTDRAPELIPVLQRHLPRIAEPEAKAAVVWMLGQFGDKIQQAPYILEEIMEGYSDEAPPVRLQLLTSAMQLFFLRPPEVRSMLGRLLETALDDAEVHTDVKDRALLYYRLLQRNVEYARKVVQGQRHAVDKFAEDDADEVQDRLFEEFNTLSVVYEQPSDRFIRPQVPPVDLEGPTHQEEEQENVQEEAAEDMLGMEEDLGEVLSLQPDVKVASSEFERAWGSWQEIGRAETSNMSIGVDLIASNLNGRHVYVMAKGGGGGAWKFFLFARGEWTGTPLFLMELNIRGTHAVVSVRGEDEDHGDWLAEEVVQCLE